MDAPSHGTVTIYKELIREVNSVLPKRKGGTDALVGALCFGRRERQVKVQFFTDSSPLALIGARISDAR
jgi:hypothetical protein